MNNKPQAKKWDYIIDAKQNGLGRIIIMSIIAVFFTALTLDQFRPKPNKLFVVAITFGIIAVISIVTLTILIIRYCCFKICVGKEGFFYRSQPFNGRYYCYTDICRCDEKLITSQHRTTSGARETMYHYYFIITIKGGNMIRIKFDKSLYEREFAALMERINKTELK